MAPNPRNLILQLLVGSESGLLSAREAVAACALFGIRENSVRVALVRLSSAGMIEAAGRGNYRVGPNAAQLTHDVRTWRSVESRTRKWSGAFIAVHCAALGRSDRVALRQRERALLLLGLRELSRDLFVRPDNLVGGVSAVRERLLKLGLTREAVVFLGSELDAERDARARSLWDGKSLTKSYTQTRQRLEKWLARADGLTPELAARESFLLGSAAIRQVVFDPLLPDPLVEVTERRAFVTTVLRFDQTGHSIWRALLASLRNDAAPTIATA